MPLTCYCDDGEFDWYYRRPNDYSEMPERKRRTRCSSCGSLLNAKDTVTEFECYREPSSDVEYEIYDDQVPLASKWLCETCSDLWFSLDDLGFKCVAPDEPIRDLVREYAELNDTGDQ